MQQSMEIIIILGNSNDKIQKNRVDRAIQHFNNTLQTYYNENTGIYEVTTFLIFSGGKSEGQKMCEYAKTKHGIDPAHCIIEDKSRSTVENLKNSVAIIERMFCKDLADPIITICTSDYHLNRSIVIMKLLFGHLYKKLKFISCNDVDVQIESDGIPVGNRKMTDRNYMMNFIDHYCSSVRSQSS